MAKNKDTALVSILFEMGVPKAYSRKLSLSLTRYRIEGFSPDDVAAYLLIARGESFENGYREGLQDNPLWKDWWADRDPQTAEKKKDDPSEPEDIGLTSAPTLPPLLEPLEAEDASH